MNIALCLFRYFAYGGLQHNFLAIARECLARGHRVRVYADEWEGEVADAFELVRGPLRGWSNHARQRHFARFVAAHRAAHPVDVLLGFNRMPGLDAYYAADGCEAEHQAGRGLLRLLPRYRHLLAFERAVFDGDTCILFIAPAQQARFQRHYPLQRDSVVLPPYLRAQSTLLAQDRETTRTLLGIDTEQRALLALGSGFRTKGLDRTLHAMTRLPAQLRARCLLLVVGQDKPARFQRLATRLGLGPQIRFLGGREDVPELLAAADLLVHPARREAGGMVLLEAAAAGLPVLASAVCGYAPLVCEHGFGRVVGEPFVQDEYAENLRGMLLASADQWACWRSAGRSYATGVALHQRPRVVVDMLESLVRR